MSCPYLKEVVMLFCQAYPVKKMVPLDRLASADPCLGKDFSKCQLFTELIARLQAAEEMPGRPACGGAAGCAAAATKEVPR
jgi:hypothetical protein